MTNSSPVRGSRWTRERTALAAALCLMAGIAVGWWAGGISGAGMAFTRAAKAASPPAPQPAVNDQLKAMADIQAAPLLKRLDSNPEDRAALIALGNLYYDARQYQAAINNYSRALALDPSDASVRTDMATALWYLGNTDRALAEFDQALTIAPHSPNTLFNRGLVRWKGKKDGRGALEDLRKLLAQDPNYEAKEQAKQMIAEIESQTALGDSH